MNPFTRTGEVALDPDVLSPPFEEVQETVLLVIAVPFKDPNVSDTSTQDTAPKTVNPRVVAEMVGAPGAAKVETDPEAADATDAPTEVVAITVNVYAVPALRPVIVQLVVGAEQVAPPGEAVAVYDVIEFPPFEAGADQETKAVVAPATAVTEVGAPGPVYGTTPLDAADEMEVPSTFVAVTENV